MAAATKPPHYAGDLYGRSLAEYIFARSKDLGLDPYQVLSVVPHEGGFQGVTGDQGTSFGPFQLHRGGRLPGNLTDAQALRWANSPAGVEYALQGIRGILRSHPAVGTGGVAEVVREYEHALPHGRSGSRAIEQEVAQSSTTYFELSRADAGTAADFWSGRGGSAVIGGILGLGVAAAATATGVIGGVGAAEGAAGGTAAGGVAGAAGRGAASGVARRVFGGAAAGGILAGLFESGLLQRGAEIAAGGVLVVLGLLLAGRVATSQGPVGAVRRAVT